MILTEAEAREKWCPVVAISDTIAHVGEGAIERKGFTFVNPGRCAASGCMMWRFDGPAVPNKDGAYHPHHGAPVKGYCGLAGKPWGLVS